MMFMVFGKGRCPLCGETGLQKVKDIYFCEDCEITFSEFGYSGQPVERVEEVQMT